ncbi:phosphodiester glycosidase family protein [Streptomyces sp. ICBB 8177]|uniref:phosphodiester glycosidase family protein n=1 Tax=Streptomyces sp. ICBB 8177 TaxID=563922 RepID=UPI001F545F05|nr:phosphodiester glycosidase family protein [Streptomyces sp. ICBB 8177]
MTNRSFHGRRSRSRLAVAVLGACAVLLAGSAAQGASAADRVRVTRHTTLAPGVTYEEFSAQEAGGTARGYVLVADLTNHHVSADLLTPGTVARPEAVSDLADSQGAVGGVNADFFDNSETQHPGVEPTSAAVGPAIGRGVMYKAAVPDGQRFGPAMPPGDSTRDVIGVGEDRVARLDRLTLSGSVSAAGRTIALRGLNQYALPVGGVGAYTSLWGSASRERAVCGTDTERGAGCTNETYEVTVRQGRVVSVSDSPGSGTIARGTVELVGREGGATALRALRVGERVTVSDRLTGAGGSPLRFAVGGFPLLRDGTPLSGLDNRTTAIRTSAGFASGGHRFYLMALDGGSGHGIGLTVAELASLMRALGASSAVDLDGGGSSTLVARQPHAAEVTVVNHPSDGAERPVPEGIGIFSR